MKRHLLLMVFLMLIAAVSTFGLASKDPAASFVIRDRVPELVSPPNNPPINPVAVPRDVVSGHAAGSKLLFVTRVAEHEAEQARLREQEARRRAAAEVRFQSAGSGRCGWSLPPCSVMNCESGGNIRAENPTSTASGKWQIVDGTWDNYGGYSHASHAPESVQDAKARELWAGGAGASHWRSCL